MTILAKDNFNTLGSGVDLNTRQLTIGPTWNKIAGIIEGTNQIPPGSCYLRGVGVNGYALYEVPITPTDYFVACSIQASGIQANSNGGIVARGSGSNYYYYVVLENTGLGGVRANLGKNLGGTTSQIAVANISPVGYASLKLTVGGNKLSVAWSDKTIISNKVDNSLKGAGSSGIISTYINAASTVLFDDFITDGIGKPIQGRRTLRPKVWITDIYYEQGHDSIKRMWWRFPAMLLVGTKTTAVSPVDTSPSTFTWF